MRRMKRKEWFSFLVALIIMMWSQWYSAGDVRAQVTSTYLLTPCRIVDTRIVGGYFIPGERREYFVYGIGVSNQGGNAAGCCLDCGEPEGVIINVTAVPVSGSGYFTVFPADVEPPLASIVNYRVANGPIANACAVENYSSAGPKEIEFLNAFGYSHLVVDVMGYLY